jgi:hypothetical protein
MKDGLSDSVAVGFAHVQRRLHKSSWLEIHLHVLRDLRHSLHSRSSLLHCTLTYSVYSLQKSYQITYISNSPSMCHPCDAGALRFPQCERQFPIDRKECVPSLSVCLSHTVCNLGRREGLTSYPKSLDLPSDNLYYPTPAYNQHVGCNACGGAESKSHEKCE